MASASVVPRGRAWAVLHRGAARPDFVAARRHIAVRAAKRIARVVYVFDMGGRIAKRIVLA
jgi:hypothetical protein